MELAPLGSPCIIVTLRDCHRIPAVPENTPRKILVTSALPYANGHINIGHLVEYIQTDIWVRFQNLRGNRCIYICADDTHGTAIMIRARQEGITEEELIAKMQRAHTDDFARFQIEFTHYGSTNSPETRRCCEEIWQSIRDTGMCMSSRSSSFTTLRRARS